MSTRSSIKKSMATLGVVVAAGVGLSACTTASAPSETTPTSQPQATTEAMMEATAAPSTVAMAGAYKDGVYSVKGNYTSPGGPESIDVKITLKNGVITESEVTPNAEKPISVKMQAAFTEGYKTLVVGKNIDEVKLDKVSGSSLTPKGFNDAIEKVKTQAKA